MSTDVGLAGVRFGRIARHADARGAVSDAKLGLMLSPDEILRTHDGIGDQLLRGGRARRSFGARQRDLEVQRVEADRGMYSTGEHVDSSARRRAADAA